MWQALRAGRRDRRGFTLIELLVVVAILIILASIVVPRVIGARQKAQESAAESNLRQAELALERYYTDNGGYPAPDNGRLPQAALGPYLKPDFPFAEFNYKTCGSDWALQHVTYTNIKSSSSSSCTY